MAARGARAAGPEDAADRRADGPRRRRSGGAKTGRGFSTSRENANVDAGLGFIRRISAKESFVLWLANLEARG